MLLTRGLGNGSLGVVNPCIALKGGRASRTGPEESELVTGKGDRERTEKVPVQ